jgi:hypothetical protein
MPDWPAPVAQNVNVNPSQGIQTLSGLMGLKQQQQQLQSQTAEATIAAQNARENQGLAQLLQNPRSLVDDQGNPNPDSLDRILAVAPTTGAEKVRQLYAAANEKIVYNTSLNNLSEAQRTSVGNVLAGVASTHGDREEYVDALTQAVQQNPGLARAAFSIASNLPTKPHLTGDPTQDAQLVATHQAQLDKFGAQSARSVAAPAAANVAPNVSMVQGKEGLTPTNINPMAAGGVAQVGPTVQQGVAPSGDTVTDAYGRSFLLNRQNNTIKLIGTGRSGAPTGAPAPAAPFAQPVAGQPQVLADVENTRAVGDQSPSNRNINQHLLDLSSQTQTGPGTQTVQKLAAAIGLPSGSRYQEITAYLDRQAAMQARAMGVPNTNAGLAASQSASGTPEYTPTALQEKVKFADALNSGAMAYRQGLDKAIGTGPTPDLSKYQAFRSAWAQNFDPDVYRVEDAQRRGDTGDLAELKKRVGANGMKALAQKSANLRLLESGQIPGG